MYKNIFSIIVLYLLNVSYAAAALEANKQCGQNTQCLIVDTMYVNKAAIFVTEPLGNLSVSYENVKAAWFELTKNRKCKDVADIVVGGTTNEDGAPDSSIPATFASHLVASKLNKLSRCTIVVNYTMDGAFADNYYDTSVELGRRSLSAVLAVLDYIRESKGFTDKIRVWGYSKGASIVESIWRQEAMNNDRTLVSTYPKKQYIDACHSNNCYYFGFGYPYTRETNNSYPISRKTASTWLPETAGYMTKASRVLNEWWRITTFSNLNDRVYLCDSIYQCFISAIDACHRDYVNFLSQQVYSDFDRFWNREEIDWTYLVAGYSWPSISTLYFDRACDN